jgi:multiple sugar transport system permease protein
MANRASRLRLRSLALALRYALLTLLAILVAFPMVWAVLSAFKPPDEIIAIPVRWLPSELHWENFSEAWQSGSFNRFLVNSVIFTVLTTGGNLLVASLAAYGFTKFRWRGRDLAFLFVLSTMMLPIEVTMVPLFLVVRSFDWVNTYQGLILPVMVDAFAVFFMRQYIQSIPDDYIDSARIDGASEIQIFSRVVVPLSVPALAGLGMIKVLVNWDQLLWPLIAAPKEEFLLLTVGLARMQSHLFNPLNWRIALALLLSLPMLVVLLVAQRYIMDTAALSGMK